MAPSDIVSKYIRPGITVANRYQIEKLVGSGAYGAIYSAIDTVSMERVAVKAVPPIHDGGKKTAIGRFQREMKVISNLRHPNIITLYDYGETEELIVFMVLEFIDGQTLSDVVDNKPMPYDDAVSVTRQIAAGLSEAHAKGVIHRDLKPQNVMLVRGRDGYEVKVLDFGMAKVLSRLGDESIVALTREGIAVGTPRYIAPEQARGKQVGPYSDLYALGLLMYEAFTGARAVKADSIESAILAHVSPKRLDLPEIDLMPKPLRPLLFKLIEKKVANRYQTAGDFIRDLDQATRRAGNMARTVRVDRLAEEDTEPEADTVVADAPRLRSFRSASQLIVDVDRLNERANGTGPHPKRRKYKNQNAEDWLPTSATEWLEYIGVILTGPIAFTLLTAHFMSSGFFTRLITGLIPTLLAFGLFLAISRNGRSTRFARIYLFMNVITIFIAHIMGPDQLALGLMRDATWYLEPFRVIPGVTLVQSAIEAIARQYVGVLMAISPDIASMVRHAK